MRTGRAPPKATWDHKFAFVAFAEFPLNTQLRALAFRRCPAAKGRDETVANLIATDRYEPEVAWRAMRLPSAWSLPVLILQ